MSFFNIFSSVFKSKSKSAEDLMREGWFLAVRLLQNESVRAELGLSPVQAGQVSALVNEARQKHRPGKVQGKERAQRVAALTGDVLSGLEKSGVLSDEQRLRLRQICWQNRGAAAFGDPNLQQALKLTDAQKMALKGIMNDPQKKQAGERERTTDARRARLESVVALLTPEQKAHWEQLKGRPFEVQLASGNEPADQEPDQDI